MSDSELPLSDEHWTAAREVLSRFPSFEEEFPSAERELAELHRRWGDSKFKLCFGLREPATVAEEQHRALFLGQISLEEAKKRISTYAHRPVDAEMLRKFFEAVGQQIHRYGRFMQEVVDVLLNPRRQPVTEADEAEIDRLVNEIVAKSTLYTQEIESVVAFLQEVRVARQAGIVRCGEYTTPSAAEMVTLTIHYARSAWTSDRELGHKSRTQPEYIKAVWGVTLFGKGMYRTLPKAQDLQTLVDEEYALARIYLRECRVDNDSGKEGVPQPVAKEYLLKVKRWSDLAIGIDEEWRYWAISPAPDFGAVFKLSEAVELKLPGGRWKEVLKSLAESDTGDRVRRADLLSRLGFFVPGAPAERDGRARPGAVEAANIEGMTVRQTTALKRLTDALSDLRRDIGGFIDGPKDRQSICLRTDSDLVLSGFVVRFLIRDESERPRFGGSR